jgi:cellulose synthase/poly-beta-1,6-N-acetylglucosamine synthase-like glycosyltransferase
MGDAGLSISIVIPTLNAGRAFGTVLHRIMGQGRVPLEIVCADLGSTDGTKHIVSQFPLARFVDFSPPSLAGEGQGGGPLIWNRAMEETHCDVVAFLAMDAVPANGDWLNHLTAPFGDPSVGGVYGRQQAPLESDPLAAFRLGQRFCAEPHWRRNRIGDAVRYKSLPFFIDNAAVRRSVWRGIHFNEHLPVGADRVWARQVVLASCTVAYAPDALVVKEVHCNLKSAYRLAVLTGYTDAHFVSDGGTLWPDSRHFAKRASWYLLKGLAWGRLPYLAIEDVVQRYGYRLGRRLDRLGPTLRTRIAPEIVTQTRRPEIDDLAA